MTDYHGTSPKAQSRSNQQALLLGAGEAINSRSSQDSSATKICRAFPSSMTDYQDIIRCPAGGAHDPGSEPSQSESYGVDSSYARPHGGTPVQKIRSNKPRTSGQHIKDKRTLVSLRVLPPPTDEERCSLLVQELGCQKGYVCTCKQTTEQERRHLASTRPPVPWPVSPSVENTARRQHQYLDAVQRAVETDVRPRPPAQMSKGLLRHKRHREQEQG